MTEDFHEQNYISFSDDLLGSIQFHAQVFPEDVYQEIFSDSVQGSSRFHQHEQIHLLLFHLLEKEKDGFALPKVVTYIRRIRQLIPTYHLSSFEFWLNQSAMIEESQKMKIRGKIVGRWIPRMEYQSLFPIGENKYFPGSHYSYAHKSPDLDTVVTSFSCFLSAFAAQVGSGVHHWVVPGGPPKESIEIQWLFGRSLGDDLFSLLALTDTMNVVSALDILSQKDVVKKELQESPYSAHSDPFHKQAVILIDKEGCYLEDWREKESGIIRFILAFIRSLLLLFQRNFNFQLMEILTKTDFSLKDWHNFVEIILSAPLISDREEKIISFHQIELLDQFFRKIFFVPFGIRCHMRDFFSSLSQFGFEKVKIKLFELSPLHLFPQKEKIIEDRSIIFREIQNILELLQQSVDRFLQEVDSLKVALEIKRKVLEYQPVYVDHFASLEEISQKMQQYHYLTVNYQEGEKKYPLGVVYAKDIHKGTFATVSWNDFSSEQDTDRKDGMEVISFIDHHKSQLQTTRPCMGIVRADAQACASIVAAKNFEINDKYSTGGMTLKEIDEQLYTLSPQHDNVQMRLFERLLKKKAAHAHTCYYISSQREMFDYLCYVLAILDDTDCLTKVSRFDVDIVKNLMNRLKSLQMRKEVEIVNFDDISFEDPQFPKKAAIRLLETKDLSSLWNVIFQGKKSFIDRMILEAADGTSESFFQDTKCFPFASVGQFKFFAENATLLFSYMSKIRDSWVKKSQFLYEQRKDKVLAIFMISTIPSAKVVLEGKSKDENYFDELWFWVPPNNKGFRYLQSFLTSLRRHPTMVQQKYQVVVFGNSDVFQNFESSFVKNNKNVDKYITIASKHPCISLKVSPGSMRSRKADISIYL